MTKNKMTLSTFLKGKEKELEQKFYSYIECGKGFEVKLFLSQAIKEAYELGKKYEKVNTGRTKKRCYQNGYKKALKFQFNCPIQELEKLTIIKSK